MVTRWAHTSGLFLPRGGSCATASAPDANPVGVSIADAFVIMEISQDGRPHDSWVESGNLTKIMLASSSV